MVPLAAPPNSPPEKSRRPRAAFRKRILLFLVLAATALLLQGWSGAWKAEFGGHPDEASHVLSGLLLRDYFCFAPGSNPITFAKTYYAHYPKIAIGHYPPGFYIFEGAWLTLFPPHRLSILAFMVFQTAFWGMLIFKLAEQCTRGFAVSLWCGVTALMVPLCQRYTSLVMSDVMLAAFCLGAVLAFTRFINGPSLRRSLWFGLLAALATLVKGAGLLLALVPCLMIVLTGRFDLLKRKALWAACLPVLAFAFPWIAATYTITQRGMVKEPLADYVRRTIPYYLKAAVTEFGWFMLLLAGAGVLFLILRARKGHRFLKPEEAAPIALTLAVFSFYCGVSSGLDERYLLPALPGVLVLAAVTVKAAGEAFSPRPATVLSLALLAGIGIAFQIFRIPEKRFYGFGPMVRAMQLHEPKGEVLIASDPSGEGAFIAELALNDRRPGWKAHRASKVIGESDWIGRDYQLRFTDAAGLSSHLGKSGIHWIVWDRSLPRERQLPHHRLLEEMLAAPAPFVLQQTFPMTRRQLGTSDAMQAVLFYRE